MAHIIIKQNAINEQDNSYISVDKLAAAARNIRGDVAFKFYIYLSSMPNGYEFDYMPKEFSEAYGVSNASAYTAVEKLAKTGYLVESESRKNDYLFTAET